MNKLDKKQIPQFAALCVLSAGVFGYFVVKIVTPSPAAAGTRPQPLAAASPAPTPSHPAAGQKTTPDAVPAANEVEAPAPTPGMRDPFMVGYVDPKSRPPLPAVPLTKPVKAAGPQVASIHEVGPASVASPGLPFGLKSLPPLGVAPALPTPPQQDKSAKAAPAPPAAPAWTVTGVLQSGAGQLAVLRSGEARRIVRTGDFVDSVYRVVSVTRSAVVLRHDKTFYHLLLGGTKTAAPTPVPPAPAKLVPPPLPAAVPAMTPGDDPQDAALPPGTQPAPSQTASPQTAMAEMMGAALRLARSYMVPAQIRVDAFLLAFRAHTNGLPIAATRPLDIWAPLPVAEDAQPALELSQDVYGSRQAFGRQAFGSHAPWQCALTTDDLDAPGAAGKRTVHYD